MKTPPDILDKAMVVCYTPIDRRHRHTGDTQHHRHGELQGSAHGLAICKYSDAEFYLFYCDADWNVLNDTCHETLERAKEQAGFEYEGTSKTWIAMEAA
ncbi:MAG TPA: hypothetical protein VG733_06570 [Chthoniobacteraceae bacterium]|nr:hypothetical protein [Chthoniobacteraceae bacterium]